MQYFITVGCSSCIRNARETSLSNIAKLISWKNILPFGHLAVAQASTLQPSSTRAVPLELSRFIPQGGTKLLGVPQQHGTCCEVTSASEYT